MEFEEVGERIDRINVLAPVIDEIITQGFNVVPYSAKLDEIERLCFEIKNSGYGDVKLFATKQIDVIKLIQKMARYGYNDHDRQLLSKAIEKSNKNRRF
jgi:hypothetical protein